ncbi:GNAT family N-acetyltransferase [Roseibacterium sp. SDUM158016]|uniref:GNAT family N-acetyltransferase n=1 Tax=Roseicyclus sediminis TaxID=2980997 RepID=UPI0021CEC2DF|nr:GNAT family N-acetyltransferase [Roseibacterium sp. SDUM158016]MCU4654845.1 GNAT family N-acetyltransferase [Roseibacterium sp. SDUM158016]
MSGLKIGPIDATAPGLVDLIAAHAAHSAAHYPAESNHNLDATALAATGARLFGGWLDDRLVAMGGYVPLAEGEGEVKSMHVREEARGTGAGRAILEAIVAAARAEGIRRLRLETGSRDGSAAARGLYRAAGFVETGPFGAYRPDPESVFMARDL